MTSHRSIPSLSFAVDLRWYSRSWRWVSYGLVAHGIERSTSSIPAAERVLLIRGILENRLFTSPKLQAMQLDVLVHVFLNESCIGF